MVFGPFNKTEFFLGAGMGYHSNDVRGTTITEYPVDRLAFPSITSSPIGPSPLLVRTRGAEAGVRSKAIEGLDSSVSVFFLDQASELVFEGDVGDTVAGRPATPASPRTDRHSTPSSEPRRCDICGRTAETLLRSRHYGQKARYFPTALRLD
jgi:hypothetical protein